RMPDLDLEEIDVLIGMSLSVTGEAIQKRIATTSYVFCASPKYLKKFGTPKKPEDLKNHKYIAHCMRNPDNELTFRNSEVITVTPFIRTNDTQTMLNFAIDGLGIVKLHHYVVKDYLERGELHQLLTAYGEGDVPIYVAYPNRRYVSSKVRCFIDFITAKMG
ncbi:MAG: LysR family transcriptional regulator, partial [Parachlamydiaceae bacterium]|nr:LysR family transcriptional regulator [Parachlamydiaceae bacterium]